MTHQALKVQPVRKSPITLLCIFCLTFLTIGQGYGKNTPPLLPETQQKPLKLADIIQKIEKRYYKTGFSTTFNQESTLKAMQITDTASGKAFFKYPGKMHWEYEMPEKQHIITDGITLWIFKPEDNQVMMGKMSAYFNNGKGASFLSDITMIQKNFDISLEPESSDRYYHLKLLPKDKAIDLSRIILAVSKTNFNVEEVVTFNTYGDKTHITLNKIEFDANIDDGNFTFTILKEMDILYLD